MVRKINDQLMLLDRAFLDPLAFPDKYAFRYEMALLKKALILKMWLEWQTDRYWYDICCTICRHVIWASSSAGKATFPGLADAFAKAEVSDLKTDWDKAHYHLSVLSQAIDGAAGTLSDVI